MLLVWKVKQNAWMCRAIVCVTRGISRNQAKVTAKAGHNSF